MNPLDVSEALEAVREKERAACEKICRDYAAKMRAEYTAKSREGRSNPRWLREALRRVIAAKWMTQEYNDAMDAAVVLLTS